MTRRLLMLVAAAGLALGTLGGPAVDPVRAASYQLCGPVTAFVAPTSLLPGALTVGGVPFVLGSDASMPSSVTTGSNLCFDITTNELGIVTGATVSGNTTSTVEMCGVVTALTQATATDNGLLGIGGQNFSIAPGASVPAGANVGEDVCADLTLDGFGRIQDGDVSANTTTTTRVCGRVDAIAEAGPTTTGSMTIENRTFALAAGSNMPASVQDGANLCMTLSRNALGQVQDGTATANTSGVVDVCGRVDTRTDATATGEGRLEVAGTSFPVAPGTPLDPSIQEGRYARLRLTQDGFGRVQEVEILEVGESLQDVCAAPAPTAVTPSPAPSIPPPLTNLPVPSTPPSESPTGPSAPPSPAVPTGPSAPSGSPQPGEGVLGFGGTNQGGGSPSAGGVLPDTSSVLRTAGVVAANAVPIIVAGAMAIAAGWLTSRRRRHERPADAQGELS